MKRFLITGVSSLLGSNLAKSLLADGNYVCGIVRPNSPKLKEIEQMEGLDYVCVDINGIVDYDDFYNLLMLKFGPNIDVWVHLAWDGAGNIGRCNETVQEKNVTSAMMMFKVAEKMGIKRFVFAGSQAEYGGSKENPNPTSPYAKAKYKFGEWARKQNTKMEYLHLIIYSIYGIGDNPNSLVASCIRTFLNGDDMILGPCTQFWNYMYIEDCVRAIKLVSVREETTTGVVEIASQTGAKLSDYVITIWSLCGRKGRLLFGKRKNNIEGDVDLVADTSRLKAYGFVEKTTFEEGISNIIEFVKK